MNKVLKSGFVEVELTPELVKKARERNKKFFERYGHAGTHRTDKNRQRDTGYLAEVAVQYAFPNLKDSDNSEVDFVCNDKTFDSKGQGCNGEPALHFAATLYEEQAKRNVDYLVFCRVKNDSTKVWICGFISKEQFLKEAKYCPAGTTNNNFTYDQARYEIEYSKLIKPDEFTW